MLRSICIYLGLACLAFSPVREYSPEDLVSQGIKRFPLESGVVKYRIQGDRSGEETLFFDHFGWREARYSQANFEMFGVEDQDVKLSLTEGITTYKVDLEEMRGIRSKDIGMISLAETAKESQEVDRLAELKMLDGGAEEEGPGEVLGKSCRIFSLSNLGTRIWVWEGIPLRIEIDLMGMQYHSEAVSIETNVEIPDEHFDLPEGVVLTDR